MKAIDGVPRVAARKYMIMIFIRLCMHLDFTEPIHNRNETKIAGENQPLTSIYPCHLR